MMVFKLNLLKVKVESKNQFNVKVRYREEGNFTKNKTKNLSQEAGERSCGPSHELGVCTVQINITRSLSKLSVVLVDQ